MHNWVFIWYVLFFSVTAMGDYFIVKYKLGAFNEIRALQWNAAYVRCVCGAFFVRNIIWAIYPVYVREKKLYIKHILKAHWHYIRCSPPTNMRSPLPHAHALLNIILRIKQKEILFKRCARSPFQVCMRLHISALKQTICDKINYVN